jgi:hypothetical protein
LPVNSLRLVKKRTETCKAQPPIIAKTACQNLNCYVMKYANSISGGKGLYFWGIFAYSN